MSFREDLKAFVDGELDSTRTEEIRSALQNDPTLQQEVAFMKLLGDAVREEAKVFEVKGAEEALNEVRAGGPIARRLRRFDLRWASALVAVLVIALIATRHSTDSASYETVASNFEANANAPTKAEQFSQGIDGVATRTPGVGGGPAEGKVGQHGPEGGLSGREDGVRAGELNGANMVNGKALPGTATPSGSDAKSATGTVPAPETAAPKPSQSASLLKAQPSRKVIQNGSLDLEMDDVAAAQSKATLIAKSVNGFIEDSNLTYSENSQATSSMTMRVPAPTFSMVMQRLQALGKVKSNSMTGEDVTAQVADVDARLTELKAEADDYVTMLRGARSVGQILEIKDRLSQVRQDIQSYQAQASALKDQSALSTIELTLEQTRKVHPKAPPKTEAKSTWAHDTWTTAVDGFKGATKFLSECVIFIFVYAPIWIPIMAIGWWLNRKQKKS